MKSILEGRPALKAEIEKIAEVAGYLWQNGWAERNGGNITVNVTEFVDDEMRQLPAISDVKQIGVTLPALKGCYFYCKGTGKRMRDLARWPMQNGSVIRILDDCASYVIIADEAVMPTSELPSHLMNHEVKKAVSGGKHRVIYHAHTTNVIALTFVLPLKDEVFTRELWEMATECPVVFPSGIGVVEWMVPGGRDIAVATSELMKHYDVAIWAHHGMFCSGEDFDLTFGLMHTVEKSAEILVKTLSMRPDKLQTITAQNFRDLARDFHVELPEKFLFD